MLKGKAKNSVFFFFNYLKSPLNETKFNSEWIAT